MVQVHITKSLRIATANYKNSNFNFEKETYPALHKIELARCSPQTCGSVQQ